MMIKNDVKINPHNIIMNMEFGVFTFIIPDTILNNMKKYMNYEFKPDKNSRILFTYDNEPDVIKEFDMKTNIKMNNLWYSSPEQQCPDMVDPEGQALPQCLYFRTKTGLTTLFEDTPVFSQERGVYILKSLKQIFHEHINWTNTTSSIYNCVYYILEPTKINAFSIMKISSNRYLFAYQPEYLNKTEVEQIVFELFMS